MVSKRIIAAALAVATTVAGLPLATAGAAPPAHTNADRAAKIVAVSEYGSYIVVMKGEPLVMTLGPDRLNTNRALAAADRLALTHDDVLSRAGLGLTKKVYDYAYSLNGFSVMASHAEAIRLAADPDVAMVLPDELRQVQQADCTVGIDCDNVVLGDVPSEEEFLGLTGDGEAYDSGITGEGVLVGVIDTGIWPEHPSFADDGTYPKPPKLNAKAGIIKCDFGKWQHNAADANFKCNNKLVAARQMLQTYRSLIGAESDEFDSARDDDGHGTHTASTAAGNAGVDAEISGRHIGTTTGIAPRAQIIAYKALGNLGGFTSDLTAAIDQAVADGVDVINYSVGGGAGLTTADAIAYLFAASAGVFVATSAGNSGPNPYTIGGPADVPWITTVGASTQPTFYEGVVTLGNATTHIGASVTNGLASTPLVDAEDSGNPLCLPGEWDADDLAGTIVLCRRGAIGRVAKSLSVSQAGGVGLIMYNVDVPNQDNLFTDNFWVPTVHVDQSVGEAIKAYIDSAGAGATASLSVGNVTQTPWTVPSMTVFSSRGPNPSAESLIKPDITAPGIQVLAAASPSPDPDAPGGHLFQAIAGTSMSSPQVAGVYALLKQAHPGWSAAMAKSAIMTSAYQDVMKNDRVTPADPFDMGAGHVDPGVVSAPGSAFNPGIVYNAGFNQYLGFLCDAAPEVFANPAATCGSLATAGIPTRAEDLNLPSIGVSALAGGETVLRRITNVADSTVTYTAEFDHPAGYTVTAAPGSVTLAPGESAIVEITITNGGGGAPGVWSFGALTWTGGGYSARSPIAVRATAIAAPAVVSGTSGSGSASFDVKFGYTGDYDAIPAGMAAEDTSLLAGQISQDPDQTFPSGDDDDGDGVVAIEFQMTGVTYARFELDLPTDDDIDLYLLGPGGDLVGSSTAGATHELIELVHPADGTYTMVVHGWSVVTQDPLPFAISTWLVDGSDSGLSVDSAPASATIGVTGTVGISWTVTSPGRYYGTVDHSDGTDVVGQTVVAVTS
jgi:subtilisin family serine protease